MYNITLRPVCPGDAPFLTHLMNLPPLLQRLHQCPSSLKDWQDAITLWLQDEDEDGYIVLMEGQPIGWFAINSLCSANRIPFLKIAVLLPEWQGKGIGVTAITSLTEELASRGFSAVRLVTDWDNFPAQACYRKCGFRIIRKEEADWPDDSRSLQYEMEKQL